MNPKRQHVGDAKESTSSQGHQGMFESGLALNLGPSPTVHRKDVRTGGFTAGPAPEDMAWMCFFSHSSPGTWLRMRDNLPIKASLWSRRLEAFWLQCSWTSYRKQDLLRVSASLALRHQTSVTHLLWISNKLRALLWIRPVGDLRD